ncbi:MAG: sulfotransferase family 2 domain-containing protein [Pseudomonadota bacterium]
MLPKTEQRRRWRRQRVQVVRRIALDAYGRMAGRGRLHFLHIRKCGGTAMKFTLKQFNSPFADCDYVIHLHPHQVTLADVPVGDKVLFVLRDPLSRFVSGFYSRHREGRPKHFSPWNDAERDAFARFTTPDELALALSAEDATLREAAESAMRGVRHIKDIYAETLISIDYLDSRRDDVLFIGFQESLEADFERLRSLLGASAEVSLPKDDYNAHRNPDDLDKRLSDKAIGNLRAWYREDFQFVEYCREWRDSLPD